MNSFYPSKKSLITSLVLGALSIICFAVFLFIIFSKIGNFKKGISENQNYSSNVEEVLRIKKEVAGLKKEISLVNSFFIQPGEEALFIERVEALGKSLGLKVVTDSVTDGKAGEAGLVPLEVVIKYEGSLSAGIQFLKKLEELPYAVTLGDINMTLVEGNVSVWTGNVKLGVLKSK